MLTQERIRELLDYDPVTGHLIWRVTKSPKAPKGSIAGSVNAKGHVNLQIDKRMYAAHQVVFALHYNHITREIDHINRNKQDNRVENLRACDSSKNKGNIGLLRSNQSGYRGVSLNKSTGKYHAQIKISGKQVYLGRFDTAEDAARMYDGTAKLYFGEFAHLNNVE